MEVFDTAAVEALAGSTVAADVLGVGVGGGAVVVDLRPDGAAAQHLELAALADVPAVVVGIGAPHPRTDVAVDDEDGAAAVLAAVAARPLTSTALALHLRASETLAVGAALSAESAVYSTLQAGPEHAAWRATRPPPEAQPPDADAPRTRVERHGATLAVTLTRPARRNAVDAAMRDAVVDAFRLGLDPGIIAIEVRAEGPSFSTGGDLGEFGALADPASAHVLRLARSAGLALHRVAAKATVFVHGPCYGAGVELPAFAGRVVAAADTTFTLPEIELGLVPGAGGTVSLTRRIGRHRAAWLAVTGATIDAPTARAWGLVDAVEG